MGSGIVQVSGQSGFNVTMVDLDQAVLDKSHARIQKSLAKIASKKCKGDQAAADKYAAEVLGRISVSTDVTHAVKDSDLVIEAIVENLDVKRKLFKQIDAAAKSSCIFASNTSSLPIGDIAQGIRSDRFGGLHFFNPVPMMKLVEVVSTDKLDSKVNDELISFGEEVGKTVVRCKDTPGFVVNRLLVPYLMEAVRMAERGDASFKDIDIGMKLGAGHPMGPFQLADYVGLDTTKFIIDGWHAKYPENQLYFPSKMLDDLVAAGKLGMKTGEGFYKY